MFSTHLGRVLLGSAVAVLLLLTSQASHAAVGNSVLLVIMDDIGVDSTMFYPVGPYRRVTTPPAAPMPNLTALAQHGVVFGNAWAQMECSPTRAEIITGQYGFRPENGVGQWIDEGRASLSTTSFTLPEAFVAAGSPVKLAHIGKWHLTKVSEGRAMPGVFGWPFYEGPTTGGALSNFFDYYKYTEVNGVVAPLKHSKIYATTDQVNDALAAINEAKAAGAPYFVNLALNAPHQPYHKPPNDLHSYDSLPVPTAKSATPPRPYYEAMTEAVDTELGRLLKTVDLKTTTVIVIGDNGTPGAVLEKPYNRAHGKSTPYEQGIKIPILAVGYGVAASPDGTVRVLDQLVSAVDLYPTILELAGVNYRTVLPGNIKIDGVSWVPLLAGSNLVPIHKYVYSDKFIDRWDNQYVRAIRNSNFKLVDWTGTNSLFNLATDPLESKNLLAQKTLPSDAAAALPELRTALAALLATR